MRYCLRISMSTCISQTFVGIFPNAPFFNTLPCWNCRRFFDGFRNLVKDIFCRFRPLEVTFGFDKSYYFSKRVKGSVPILALFFVKIKFQTGRFSKILLWDHKHVILLESARRDLYSSIFGNFWTAFSKVQFFDTPLWKFRPFLTI